MMRTQKPHAIKPNDSKCFKIKSDVFTKRKTTDLDQFEGEFSSRRGDYLKLIIKSYSKIAIIGSVESWNIKILKVVRLLIGNQHFQL